MEINHRIVTNQDGRSIRTGDGVASFTAKDDISAVIAGQDINVAIGIFIGADLHQLTGRQGRCRMIHIAVAHRDRIHAGPNSRDNAHIVDLFDKGHVA